MTTMYRLKVMLVEAGDPQVTISKVTLDYPNYMWCRFVSLEPFKGYGWGVGANYGASCMRWKKSTF